jgi:hypothetical protein
MILGRYLVGIVRKNNIVHFKKNKNVTSIPFFEMPNEFLHSSTCSPNTLEKSKAFTTHFGFTWK